jgi:hypothetical protein
MSQMEERDYAAALFRYSPPIERESYALDDGGIVTLGLFSSYDLYGNQIGFLLVELYFFPNSEIRYGTVRKIIDDAVGLNEIQEIKRRWDSRKTP